MGIISKSSNIDGVCGKVKGNVYTTVGVTVPGKIVHWIKSFKATEIEDCLRDWQIMNKQILTFNVTDFFLKKMPYETEIDIWYDTYYMEVISMNGNQLVTFIWFIYKSKTDF